MKIKAFAKINLTLDITGVREDGFHTLRSVMVPVSLCDEIEIQQSKCFLFDCNIKSLVDEKNLVVRAAKRFSEKSGIEPSVSIYLEKKIPFPAGLGGGSSDAAAVLKGLNLFFGEPLDSSALFELAEALGSDVPVCLLGQPALCEGRGEVLTPIELPKKLCLVIAIGSARLSTPEVYREYDASGLAVRNDSDAFLASLVSQDIERTFGNAFEPVADRLAPETKLIREKMLSLGALASHLSGSGPSVYGVFECKEKADNAASELEALGFSAYYCETI